MPGAQEVSSRDSPRLCSDIIRKSRKARISQDMSSARDTEALTPGDDPVSPHARFTKQSDPAFTDAYEGKHGEVWTCLACRNENTEPGYCIYCSVVRGSTGKKGLSANVVKRTVN